MRPGCRAEYAQNRPLMQQAKGHAGGGVLEWPHSLDCGLGVAAPTIHAGVYILGRSAPNRSAVPAG